MAIETIDTLLLPLGRGLATNWQNGNRREAGAALAHITGSGKPAHHLVQSFSRVFKKVCRSNELLLCVLLPSFYSILSSQPLLRLMYSSVMFVCWKPIWHAFAKTLKPGIYRSRKNRATARRSESWRISQQQRKRTTRK